LLYYVNPHATGACTGGPIWSLLAPLSLAARDDQPLRKPLVGIVRSLGFESFTYGMSTAKTVDADTRFYHWTTSPRQWVEEYDRLSYVEVDPRVAHGWTDPTPLIWDQRIAHDRPAVQAFLDHAAKFGIGSGVCVFFRDHRYCRVIVTIDSPHRSLDEARRTEWADALIAVLMLGLEFHAIYLRSFVARGVPPQQQGAPISRREQQCLILASKGQTSADIAGKLDLSERTINFHFGNILSKLAVANRGEAIAVAIMRGFSPPASGGNSR
jgi:DNA-binding CsgD family transcriptional regulator